jgi:hypothetical protein
MRWLLILLLVVVSCSDDASIEDTKLRHSVEVSTSIQRNIYKLAISELLERIEDNEDRWKEFKDTDSLFESVYITPYSDLVVDVYPTFDTWIKGKIKELMIVYLNQHSEWIDAAVSRCWYFALGELIYAPHDKVFHTQVEKLVNNILVSKDTWLYAQVHSHVRLPTLWYNDAIPHWISYYWGAEILYNAGYPSKSYVILSLEE